MSSWPQQHGLPIPYEGGRLSMLVRIIRNALREETAKRGRLRGAWEVARLAYPVFRVTGGHYWNTRVWRYDEAAGAIAPTIIPASLFKNEHHARLWDCGHDVSPADFDPRDICEWRGWRIPMPWLWGCLVPDRPQATHAEAVRKRDPDPD